MRGDSQLVSTRSKTTLALKYAPYRCFLPRLDAHLYVGQRNKAYLRHYGVPEHRLFFVPHFVDTGLFAQGAREAETSGVVSEIRARLGIPQHAFVFLFVGKMIPKKRPGDFIEACLKIFKLSGGSHVRALLVGDGPLRSSLENLAEPAAHQVHFAGFQNQRELPAMYKAANALVLPSDGDETWGLVVNEAFACGIPAVVSDACGCAPDLIEEGRTGYTFPVGDVGSLSQRMLALKEFCDKKPAVLSQALAKKTSVYSMEKATEGLVRALSMVTKTQATAKVPFGTVKTKD
jgi:glycosyltransferase involved in cell wall biosynthesis